MSDTRGPIATEGEYQGKPSLTLAWRADSPYPFSFGVTKARLILACLAEIQAFADKHPDEGKGNRGRGRPAAQRQERRAWADGDVEYPGQAAGLPDPRTDLPEMPTAAAPAKPRTTTPTNDEPPC